MPTASLKKAFAGIPQLEWNRALRRIFAAMRSSFLFGSATFDPASLVDAAGATTTVTVTGAVLGDYVPFYSFSLDLQGITVTAWVSAANTVSVRFQNESGGTLDLASGTLRVVVAKAVNFSATVLLGMEANT